MIDVELRGNMLQVSKYNYYVEEDYLVFNLISTSIIKLEEEKYIGLEENRLNVFSDEEIKALKEMLFITDHISEREYYSKNKIKNRKGNRLGLTILPTTSCNARCHYCYQGGLLGAKMSA